MTSNATAKPRSDSEFHLPGDVPDEVAGEVNAAHPHHRPLPNAFERVVGMVTGVLGATLLVAEIFVLAYGVTFRYFLNIPETWTAEVAVILFLWLSMLGAVLGIAALGAYATHGGRRHVAGSLAPARRYLCPCRQRHLSGGNQLLRRDIHNRPARGLVPGIGDSGFVSGHRVADLVHPDAADRARQIGAVQDVASGRGPSPSELPSRCSSGSSRTLGTPWASAAWAFSSAYFASW